MTIAATFAKAIQDFRRALPDLLLFDVLFRIIALIALTPLLTWLFDRFVASSGNSAIGNFDIALFLLTPLGIVITLVLAVLACTISFARLAGLLYIGAAADEDRRVTYADALRFIFTKRLLKVVQVSFLLLVVIVLVTLPFVGGALFAADWLLTEHDINYYLDAQPPEYIKAVIIGSLLAVGAVVVAVLVSVPLIFVLPHALVTDASLWEAFRQSRRMAHSLGFSRIAGIILAWIAAWFAASFVLNNIIQEVGEFLIHLTGDAVEPLLIVLGGLVTTSLVANFILSFIAVSLACLIVAQLYKQACRNTGTEIPPIAEHSPALQPKPQWSLPNKAPLVAALVALGLTVFSTRHVMEGYLLDNRVEISAHRGASMAAPENTISAVQQAIAAGADFVEFDVQRTADGVIIVNHDADLMRVAGSPLVIANSTLEELQAIDVGSHFSTDFADERLATLEDVIEIASGKIKLIVELKSYRDDAPRLVADVVQLLRDHQLQEDAVIMSLKYSEVVEVERIAPEFISGYISSASLGNIAKLEADFLAVSKKQATEAFIGAVHATDKEVYVWTVDQPKEMATMIDRGVDNIITNDPATAVAVLEEREDLSNTERILLHFKSLYLD